MNGSIKVRQFKWKWNSNAMRIFLFSWCILLILFYVGISSYDYLNDTKNRRESKVRQLETPQTVLRCSQVVIQSWEHPLDYCCCCVCCCCPCRCCFALFCLDRCNV
jgi:hypothetical protein